MNQTLNSSFLDQDSLATSIQVGALLLVFFVALIGNAAVIIILMHKLASNHFKMRRISFYIANLSVADIVVALFSIFPQIFEIVFKFFKYSEMACKFIKFGQVFSVYGSTMALVLMAYDRYNIVYKTDKQWNKERGFYQIIFSWSVSFILSFPQLFVFKVRKLSKWNKSICCVEWETRIHEAIYVFYHFIFQYLVPSMLLIYFYVKIFVTIVRYNKEIKEEKKLMDQDTHAVFNIRKSDLNLNDGDKEEFDKCNKWYKNTLTKSKIDTLILTFAIVITFILCGLPFYLSILVNLFFPSIVNSSTKYLFIGIFFKFYFYNFFSIHLSKVMSLLFQLNSCANPIIYLIFNQKIYKYFK